MFSALMHVVCVRILNGYWTVIQVLKTMHKSTLFGTLTYSKTHCGRVPSECCLFRNKSQMMNASLKTKAV
jgi:hypothetical protein